MLAALLQTCETIAVGLQIVIVGARFASFLLERLCQLITQLLVETDADDFLLVDMAIESASNLLSYLLVDNPMPFAVDEVGVRNDLVMKSLDYVETLLTVCFKQPLSYICLLYSHSLMQVFIYCYLAEILPRTLF